VLPRYRRKVEVTISCFDRLLAHAELRHQTITRPRVVLRFTYCHPVKAMLRPECGIQKLWEALRMMVPHALIDWLTLPGGMPLRDRLAMEKLIVRSCPVFYI
jgi:hypothetical protein